MQKRTWVGGAADSIGRVLSTRKQMLHVLSCSAWGSGPVWPSSDLAAASPLSHEQTGSKRWREPQLPRKILGSDSSWGSKAPRAPNLGRGRHTLIGRCSPRGPHVTRPPLAGGARTAPQSPHAALARRRGADVRLSAGGRWRAEPWRRRREYGDFSRGARGSAAARLRAPGKGGVGRAERCGLRPAWRRAAEGRRFRSFSPALPGCRCMCATATSLPGHGVRAWLWSAYPPRDASTTPSHEGGRARRD